MEEDLQEVLIHPSLMEAQLAAHQQMGQQIQPK